MTLEPFKKKMRALRVPDEDALEVIEQDQWDADSNWVSVDELDKLDKLDKTASDEGEWQRMGRKKLRGHDRRWARRCLSLRNPISSPPIAESAVAPTTSSCVIAGALQKEDEGTEGSGRGPIAERAVAPTTSSCVIAGHKWAGWDVAGGTHRGPAAQTAGVKKGCGV